MSSPWSSTSRWRAALSGALALSLFVSMPQLQATAAPDKPKPIPHRSAREKSVPVTAVAAKPGAPDNDAARAVSSAPQVTWPTAGRAEIALPAATPTVTASWSDVLAGRPTKTALGPAAKAGTLPIAVGPSSTANRAVAAATPTRVEVAVEGRVGNELRFGVRRTDGKTGAGLVSVRVDYTSFQNAFGGDYNTRLKLFRVPACAAKTPQAPACAATPVATRNDGSGELSGELPVTATNQTLAVRATAAGSAGDSTVTSLNETATWQVGGSSGDFTWNYPMAVPPSLGGPKPDLALTYSSGSLDGRTTAANSQSSWVGAGFELAPGGSIERRYASCGVKTEQTGNNGTSITGDLCWATDKGGALLDNATFTLNGSGGELIRDDQTGSWHPRNDDGITVERLTGKDNPDLGPATGPGAKGEAWVLTDKNGTKYYFGLNKLPTTTEATNSVWTVPVFGNHAGEPCNAATFAASYCDQAYKWNLDYVVDAHGNSMSYFYDLESNRYGRNGNGKLTSSYTRAGNIKRIDYGRREGDTNAKTVARVNFVTADRCYKTSGCVAADYPDTPLDQECSSTTDCGTRIYPTFWTKKRLASVTTEVWRGTAFAAVNRWTPRYTFQDPKDGRQPLLWLDGITNTGLVGGTKAMPEMTFAGIMLPNRVVGTDGLPAMNWPRIQTITYGSGGQVVVGYKSPDCSLPGNVPAPDENGKRCHPIKWTPQGQAERQDWFGKYVVEEVTESDLTTGTIPVVTKVEYLTPPAWRHDEEDGLVEVGRKTWSQWRGYERVRVTKGDGTVPPTVTENTYFRGMDGDKRADDTTKTVKVKDSTGVETTDTNALAGMLRESSTMHDGKIADRSITDPWLSGATATRNRSWGTTQSFKVLEKGVRQDKAGPTGTYQRTGSQNEYDATGKLLRTNDSKDLADAADDTCTRFEYFANPANGLAELPARKQTVGVACDKSWTKTDVLSDAKTSYNATGDATKTERLTGFDPAGAPQYQTLSTSTFDSFGRVRTAQDPAGATTKVDYTPATGGPVTQTKTTQPDGQTSQTFVDPAWGEEVAVVDPAARRTDSIRDPLGRVLRTYLPGRARNATPNVEYSYGIDPLKPGLVTTKTLQADGTIDVSYDLTDGLMRKRQTQKASPDGVGRVVTDYHYDSRGLLVKENGPYYNEAPPTGETVVLPDNDSMVPTQKLTQYDDQELPETESIKSFGQLLSQTTHSVAAGTETIDPPKGEQATTKLTDEQGRLVELRKYAGDTPTGSYDATKYTYHEAGQLATVTDPAGNVWRYDYDLLGHKIKDVDPDKGTTTYTYNELDQQTSATDAKGNTLTFKYDGSGRRTAVYDGSTLVTEWKYDTIKPGSLTSSTRYVDGNPYTIRYTGYDDAGHPTGSEVVVPASEGKLAGTYPVTMTYADDGQQKTVGLPGVGGLPAETLTTEYNEHNMPISLTGADQYVSFAEYSPYKETRSIAMAASNGNWAQLQYDYEDGTRRLSRAGVVTANEEVADVRYSYDQAGNVTKITDKPAASSGEATDTQCFGYDGYRRLTQAWTPAAGDCTAAPAKDKLGGPAPYWHSWTFDVTGNRKTEKRATAAGDTISTYTYPDAGQARPHAVTKVVTTGPGVNKTEDFGYDANGSLTSRTGQTFDWGKDGKLAETVANGKKTSYVNDADGNRLIRRDAKGTTLYLGQTELLLGADQTLQGTRYYSFGQQTVAVRHAAELTWTATNHQGSVSMTINPGDLTVQRKRLTPYGEVRGATPTAWPGERGFVGGTEDTDAGLVHLGAREYDTGLGKFISVDPVVDFEDPQQLNAYAYANNSPVTFSDADGQRYVTETVTTYKTILKVIIKKIVEYRKEVIKLHVRSLVSTAMIAMAVATGHYALAAMLSAQTVVYRVQIKRIERYIRVLTKQVIRIVKRIQRYVGPDEKASLAELLKQATALSDSSKGSNSMWQAIAQTAAFANASRNWLIAAKMLDEAPKGGGGASGGGDPANDPGFHGGNNDPGDESWLKFGIISGAGATGAAGAAAIVCAIAEPCGAAALLGGLVIAPFIGFGAGAGGTAIWNDVNTSKGETPSRLLQARVAPWTLDFAIWFAKANTVSPEIANTPDNHGPAPCVYAMGAGSGNC
jgi:RHS repeat-associated protein